MKHLIQHLFKTNKKEILENSFGNCHVRGLYSISLLKAPGKHIRMYITDKNGHDMHLNYANPVSLAFHPHHCELTLHCIHGTLTNIQAVITHDTLYGTKYAKWLYRSEIVGDGMSFALQGFNYLKNSSTKTLTYDDAIYLPANAIHTVACPPNSINAWLVYEGAEDAEYKPLAWSNEELGRLSTDGLYTKLSWNTITKLLEIVI